MVMPVFAMSLKLISLVLNKKITVLALVVLQTHNANLLLQEICGQDILLKVHLLFVKQNVKFSDLNALDSTSFGLENLLEHAILKLVSLVFMKEMTVKQKWIVTKQKLVQQLVALIQTL